MKRNFHSKVGNEEGCGLLSLLKLNRGFFSTWPTMTHNTTIAPRFYTFFAPKRRYQGITRNFFGLEKLFDKSLPVAVILSSLEQSQS
jgi:hypothetical protein